MKKLAYSMLAIAALLGVVAAGEQLAPAKALVTQNVMFVPVGYNQGQWYQADEVQVAPCEPPSKPSLANELDPSIRAFDGNGEEIYQQGMRNPRLVLIEDPKEPVALLSEIRFELRLPYVRGIERVEFWEFPRQQKEPSLVVKVDPNPQIPEKADCQVPEFVPDALRKQ